ncbi:uncharacterized protein N7529_002062 [Penicillium soppii]|uniref:uncharacterized protein n=1 Tax=Penicillium soppii TaxID=69789 RepID=UPI0025476A03|nr:uncharacterized protein N7529_002062 [Penicillium soppii]KAJ5876478.1 hypothetical protein N7529_002062 [Penicillium soppii]
MAGSDTQDARPPPPPLDNTIELTERRKKQSQDVGLPAIGPVTLTKISVLEETSTNVEDWHDEVYCILRPLRLHKLLDHKRPRPKKGDKGYEQWSYWSTTVSGWIFTHLHSNLKDLLRPTLGMGTHGYAELSDSEEEEDEEHDMYADVLMKEITRALRGGNLINQTILDGKRFLHLKRNSFGTVKDYITAFRRHLAILEKRKIAPPPLGAFIHIIDQLGNESPKLNFIIEQISRKQTITRAEFDEFCKDLQVESDTRESGEAAAARGSRNNNKKKRPSTTAKQEDDKPQSQTPRASEDDHKKQSDNNGSGKKFRGAPPKGKDIHQYAKEKREAEKQVDDNGNCSFCGLGPHNAKNCYHLADNIVGDWKFHRGVWAYTLAKKKQDGSCGMAITAMATGNVDQRWLLDSGSRETMTSHYGDFFTYDPVPATHAYAYRAVTGERVITKGKGMILVQAKDRNGIIKSVLVAGWYSPTMDESSDEEDTNDNDGIAFRALSAMEIHRRLGHVGKAKMSATIKDAIMVEDLEMPSCLDIDCEACLLAKSRRKVSREPQVRVQDAAWKFHIDTQTKSPPGPNGEKYWVPIVDDATRMGRGICTKTKEEISTRMIEFCEEMKLLIGRYPGIWRLDNGTEFKRFITWGKKRGFVFELTPPYTAEPNGTAEWYGGYINEIGRTMIVDSGLDETLWPFAHQAAIYIVNRLANSETGKSPITLWRELLHIQNTKPTLKHLRPWGSTAYVHIPKDKRVQSRKAAPRAWKGYLIGYEGDGGHVYQIWDPVNQEMKRSRDVAFHKPSDEHDDGETGAVREATPAQPSQTILPDSISSYKTTPGIIPRREIRQIEQAPSLHIPSSTHLFDRSTAASRPRTRPTLLRAHAPLQRITEEVIQPQRMRATEDSGDEQRRAILNERLHRLQEDIETMSNEWQDIRQETERIEERISNRSTSIEPTPTPTVATAPASHHTPDRPRSPQEYRFPFLSPDQLRLYREESEQVSEQTDQRANQQTVIHMSIEKDSSPVPAPVSPSSSSHDQVASVTKEVISVSSTPDPTLPPPSRRVSHRRTKGCPPERYSDPNRPLLSVERASIARMQKKRPRLDRHEKTSAEEGGNNGEEGVGQRSAGSVDDAEAAPASSRTDSEGPAALAVTAPVKPIIMFNDKPLHGKDVIIPTTYKQAQKSPHWEFWHAAMAQQIEDLNAQKTYTLVLKPKRASILPGKWVYTVKTNTYGFVNTFKARWVVCGNFQQKKDDREDCYAPVHYPLKDLGEPKQYLGCLLERDYDAGTIRMSQKAYVQKILHKADMLHCKGRSIPLPATWNWSEGHEDATSTLEDNDDYLSVVGSLNWLAMRTRPDIRFYVTKLQHKSANTTIHDQEAMVQVLRYLREHPDRAITLGKKKELQFYAYADASHGDNLNYKSTEGAVWFFGGSPIQWSTRKQTIMAPSTTAAEWCALDQPARDGMWLRKLAVAFSFPRASDPLVIYTDNINTQLLLNKKTGRNSTRWLNMRYFFVKDAAAKGYIDLERVESKANVADGFTKPLGEEAFPGFITQLGM